MAKRAFPFWPRSDKPEDQPREKVEVRGEQRTQLDCTDCGKCFIAEINADLEGDHVVVCPYCGHQHCRRIKNGKVTEFRWTGRNAPGDNVILVERSKIWKSGDTPIQTSSTSEFLKELWLNRYGGEK